MHCQAYEAGRIVWWIVSIAVLIIGGFSANLISEIHSDMSAGVRRESRLTVVEAAQTGFNQRLDRIEQKIDVILDKVRR